MDSKIFHQLEMTALWGWLNLVKDIKQRTPLRLNKVAQFADAILCFTDRSSYVEWVKLWKQEYRAAVALQCADKAALRQPHTLESAGIMSGAAVRAQWLVAMLYLRVQGKRRYPTLPEVPPTVEV